MSAHPRRPLVLAATARAVDEARRLGFAGVLENAVQGAIEAGSVVGGTSRDGGEIPVLLYEHGLAVRVRRTRSRLTGRRCWLPFSVERLATRKVA
jgi:hypothetical protein